MKSFLLLARRRTLCVFALASLATVAAAQSFSVSPSAPIVTTYPTAASVPVIINVASSTYFNPVNVTLQGLPAGVTVSPASVMVTPGNSGTLYLTLAKDVADAAIIDQTLPLSVSSGSYTVTAVGAVGATTATSTFTLTIGVSNPSFTPSTVTLPVMNINTGGTAIASKDISTSGTITLTSATGTTTYLSNAAASFKLHGNSTSQMPKKPYTVKLGSSVDLLANMGVVCPYKSGVCDKSKSYVLLANYDDKTLLRDWAASDLALAIPYGSGYLAETAVPSGYTGVIPTPSGNSNLLPWAPHSVFVELYVNGAYSGVYQLIEKVNVDSHRLNITELTETQTSGDLTGGYMLEIDQNQDEAYVFTTPQGVPIGLIDPDFTPDPEISAQTSYINTYVNTAENALFSSNFTDPATGWRSYFDEASAINFYLVNDIMGNTDGGSFGSSDYLYKAIDNPFIYMGPIWDFDQSSGNKVYLNIVDPTTRWMAGAAKWYVRWFQDPGFSADVTTQFNALKNNGVFANWIARVQAQATKLQQGQVNNFSRWPILGQMVWPNGEAAGSYNGEVSYLTDWLNLRLDYFDSLFNAKSANTVAISAGASTVRRGDSITFNASVSGGASPTGTMYFLSNNVLVGSAALDGSGNAVFTTSGLNLGNNSVRAVYGGDSLNALSQSSTTAITVAEAIATSVTSLANSVSPIAVNSNETFTVSVVGNSGASTPTGTVTFSSNGTAIGTVALSGGTASLDYTQLAVGTDSIQATYSGDTNYSASTSNAVSVVVSDSSVSVTFNTAPSGLVYMVDGVTYATSQTFAFDAGSAHTISTVATQSATGTLYNFASWSDSGSLSHTISVPLSGGTYTASFNTSYLLTATPNFVPLGTVTTAQPAGTYYASGSVVSLNATAAQGCAFLSWSGDVANPTTAATTITMSAPEAVQAIFGGGTGCIDFHGSAGPTLDATVNGDAMLSGAVLELTNNNASLHSSAFFNAPVNVQSFVTDFTFSITGFGDGMMFVIQNQGLTALGRNAGYDLGYGEGASGIQHSVGIKFDVNNNGGEGTDSTGIYTNGAQPALPFIDLSSTGVNLRSGNLLRAHMTYNGATLSVTITDTVTSASATQNYTVDIPSVVGATTAYVGFTAASGTATAYQDVFTWQFSSSGALNTPTFSPIGGTYPFAQNVTINETNVAASIYYTTNGSTPTTSSTLYTGPFAVSSTSTVKAIAALYGNTTSVASATYTIVPPSPTVSVSAASVHHGDASSTLSATISFGSVAPTGAVTFQVASGATVAGSCTVSGSSETCTADYPTASLAPGTFTISTAIAADSVYASGSGTGTLTVYDDLASLTVTGLPATTLTSTAYNFTVTAVGATTGTTETTFNGAVTLTSTDPLASFPVQTYTFQPSDNGAHTFSVTFGTAGNRTVTATSGSISGGASTTVGDNIWYVRSGTLTKLGQTGTQRVSASGGGVSSAVDSAGGFWSIDASGSSVTHVDKLGNVLGSYTGSGITSATSLAIDGLGTVWITDGNGRVSALTSTGAAAASLPMAAAGNLSAPASISVDGSGSLWIANAGNNTITEVLGVAAPATAPTVTSVTNAAPGVRP